MLVHYEIQNDFSEDEADLVSGRSTVRTAQLDAEFSNIQLALTGLLTALTQIQRADGSLLDQIVNISNLSTEVLALITAGAFTVRGPWVTATVYATGDIVGTATGTYVALEDHTSGVFATDLAAGKWTPIWDSTTLTAGAITFTPAGTIAAANVQAAIEEAASEALQKSSNLADLTSLPNARTNLGVLSKAEIQAAAATFVVNTGTSDALAVAPTPAITALVDGMTLIVQATGANTVVDPTLNVSGLGALTIKRAGALPLTPGDIPAGAARAILSYHATGTYWELLNPQSVVIGVAGTDIVSLPGGLAGLSSFGDFFDITVAGTINSITAKNRGTRIAFRTILGNTFAHDAGSIIMRHAVTEALLPGEIIEFISLGAGVWSEFHRRDLSARERVAIELALFQFAR